jgi:hypothetical protein
MDAIVGSSPPVTCSPRTSAYSSAIQYTTSVTRTEMASARVGSLPPAAAMIAAVMMAP